MFVDLLQLAKTQFDTIRVCEDENILALASGYGHTHDSIIKLVQSSINRRFFPSTYIIYLEDNQLYWNLEDISGERKVSFKRGLKYILHHAELEVFYSLYQQEQL